MIIPTALELLEIFSFTGFLIFIFFDNVYLLTQKLYYYLLYFKNSSLPGHKIFWNILNLCSS